VRPIDDVLARMPGIAGATDLGDGRPTLLLDLIELGAGISAWRAEVSS
jgi:two-component system chemotaxis sensor kinase CheA